MPIDLMLGLLIGSMALGLLLLFDLLVGRGAGDGVILRLRGRIDGPGRRGAVAHRPGASTPFLLKSRLGLTRILPRDAVVRAPWPLQRRALRVGERVTVDGLLGQERVNESLYRDAGSREAIDAVRLIPWRWALLRAVALVSCGAILLGGITLWRRPLLARLAWGLACPPGAVPAYREQALPRERAPIELSSLGDLRGTLAACTVDGRPHGPAVERWRGQYHEAVWRRAGSYLDGKQHGHWVTWSPDGKVVAEGELLAGKRNGVFRSWHENGRLRTKEDYLEGRPHGLWTSWDRHGAIEDRGMYLEGKRVGTWTIRSGDARCPFPLRWRQPIESVELTYQDGALEGPASCSPPRMRPPLVGEIRAGGRAVRLFTPDPLGSRPERERIPWRATIAPERIGCRLCASPDPRHWPQLGVTEISLDRPDPDRAREHAISEQLWHHAEDLLRCVHLAPDGHEPRVEELELVLRVEPTGRISPVAGDRWPEPVLGCLRGALERWPWDELLGVGGRELVARVQLGLALHRDRARD